MGVFGCSCNPCGHFRGRHCHFPRHWIWVDDSQTHVDIAILISWNFSVHGIPSRNYSILFCKRVEAVTYFDVKISHPPPKDKIRCFECQSVKKKKFA